MTYDVRIQWLERDKIKCKWERNISAADILEACKIALERHEGEVCASVSCVWYNWKGI